MIFRKKYDTEEATKILNKFISIYVDKNKISKYILLWNSLKCGVKTKCLPFCQIEMLDFFKNKILCLYDERNKILWQTNWKEIVSFINNLEIWEENIDFLIFDSSFEWFVAITHEDLLTICVGNILD